MTENALPPLGSIFWRDLTVPDAGSVSEFYSQVVGWKASPHDMGDYHDFDIRPPGSAEVIAGICHARGANAAIPPVWLMYIVVEDVDASAQRCLDSGGAILDGPRSMGGYRFCIFRDPAGAVAALFSQKPVAE